MLNSRSFSHFFSVTCSAMPHFHHRGAPYVQMCRSVIINVFILSNFQSSCNILYIGVTWLSIEMGGGGRLIRWFSLFMCVQCIKWRRRWRAWASLSWRHGELWRDTATKCCAWTGARTRGGSSAPLRSNTLLSLEYLVLTLPKKKEPACDDSVSYWCCLSFHFWSLGAGWKSDCVGCLHH